MSQQLQSNQVQGFSTDNTNTINFLEFFDVLVKHKRFIIVLTILSLLGSYYYAKVQPTIYKSEIILFPSNDNSSSSSMGGGISRLAGMAGIPIGQTGLSAGTGKAFEILKTRKFLLKFSKENNLKKIIFQSEWDGDRKSWHEKEPSDEDLYQILLDSIEIKTPPPKAISNKLSVVFKLRDVDDYSEIANILTKMINNINALQKDEFISKSDKKIKFLTEEVEKTSVLSIQLILHKMIEENVKLISVASATDGFTFDIIDPAVVPIKPEPKNTLIILFIGLLMGLVISIALSVMTDYFNKNTP